MTSLPSMARMIRIFVVWIGLARCSRFQVKCMPAI
nr:MAG TPA: hypothetical protein [Caudoviricetes sp.]